MKSVRQVSARAFVGCARVVTTSSTRSAEQTLLSTGGIIEQIADGRSPGPEAREMGPMLSVLKGEVLNGAGYDRMEQSSTAFGGARAKTIACRPTNSGEARVAISSIINRIIHTRSSIKIDRRQLRHHCNRDVILLPTLHSQTKYYNLNARVILLPVRCLIILAPSIAFVLERIRLRESDGLGSLEELHTKTLADVPCDVTAICVSNKC
jgi:hypothetical protein